MVFLLLSLGRKRDRGNPFGKVCISDVANLQLEGIHMRLQNPGCNSGGSFQGAVHLPVITKLKLTHPVKNQVQISVALDSI